MNYHLISSIIKGIWAIDPTEALGYAPLLQNIFGQSPVVFEFDEELFKPYSISNTSEYSRYSGWNNAPEGSIAIIPVQGPLMKNDQYCGPVGMETMGKMVKEADNSPNISGIILKVDSPGGTVDGTETFANIVKATKKPVIAVADGLVASAALWIASAADEIWATNGKTQVGSIGTMLSFADLQPAYEKLGVKFHNIVADQSKDKNKTYEDIRAGRYDDYKKEVLNPLAQDFIDAIKNNLNPTDDQLTGKVFFAENVIGTLVTKIGTFDEAVSYMLQKKEKSNNSNNNKAEKQMKNFETINKVLGVELEMTEEGVYLNEEQLSVLDKALSDSTANADALKKAQENLQKEQKARTEANQQIQQLTAEVEKLRKKPGAETAKAVTETEIEVDKEKDENVVRDNKGFIENLSALEKEFEI